MIIGNGNIASILEDRLDVIFFASGISNSSAQEGDPGFRREIELMSEVINTGRGCLFYFSTISIFYKTSPYTNHKKKMEQIIRSNFNNYNIIRIGNLTWDKNPNTFINALRAKKAKGEPFEILDEYRWMINKEELLLLTNNLPLIGQNEINVFGRMAKVKDLI
jgi:hypothetical protein